MAPPVTLQFHQEDNDEDDIDPIKMVLLGGDEDGVNGKILDGVPKPQLQQHHYIRSTQATVTIRQLPSKGLSFQLWPAATSLVTLLDNHRLNPSNSPLSSNGLDGSSLNILELGSGTGIVGIVAAVTLTANVTVTDLPHVIDNLKFNVDANAELVARFGGKVHVAPLRWGEADDVEVLGRRFDLILASDVVYHDHLYEPLLKTLRLMLVDDESENNGEKIFVMGHLRRWKKESIFFKKARKLFDVQVIHSDKPHEGSRIGVVVYRFAAKRKNHNGSLQKGFL